MIALLTSPVFPRNVRIHVWTQFVEAMPSAELNIIHLFATVHEDCKEILKCHALRWNAQPTKTVQPIKFVTIQSLPGLLELEKNAFHCVWRAHVHQEQFVLHPTMLKHAHADLLS